MPALIDIRRRIRSTKSTQQITKAMKMVSAAKLRRAQEAMFAARPYARKMMEVLNSLATRAQGGAHPLLGEALARGRVRACVNEELVSGSTVVTAGDAVALFPPVSGG